jgi:hypothetical protein
MSVCSYCVLTRLPVSPVGVVPVQAVLHVCQLLLCTNTPASVYCRSRASVGCSVMSESSCCVLTRLPVPALGVVPVQAVRHACQLLLCAETLASVFSRSRARAGCRTCTPALAVIALPVRFTVTSAVQVHAVTAMPMQAVLAYFKSLQCLL